MGPIAQYLGVDHWQSSEYYIDSEGDFSGIKTIFSGDHKAKYLLELSKNLNIPIDRATAYSDSIDDLPFLESAGKAVVVNPRKRMRKISLHNKWEII